jgi:UDP-glucose 6-dehydrogenase
MSLLLELYPIKLFDLSKALKADYNNIYRIFELDQNINERHLIPENNNYRGANGKCLPKDTDFLIKIGEEKSKMALLETARILNNLYLKVREQ